MNTAFGFATSSNSDRLKDAFAHAKAARGLRIASVEPVLLSAPLGNHGVGWSGGVLTGVTAGLVRVTTTDGLYGLGETYAGMFVPEVVRTLLWHYGRTLAGRDVSQISEIWSELYTRNLYWGRYGVSVSVLSAIEMALWDLVGKALDRPVVDLLGGTAHSRLPLYASGGMEGSDDQLRAEQRRHVTEGFRATKIRIGVDAARDAHRVAVTREEVGPEVAIAADAVQGSNPNPWRASEAIAVAQRLEEFDLLWLEEPCAANDVEGHRECRAATRIPIAGGETCTTARQFAAFVAADTVDIAQPDASHIGGIGEALVATGVAQSLGLSVAMHAWGSGVGLMANIHVGFASESCRWLEYPVVGNPLVLGLLVEPISVVEGSALAPTAPGLGVCLDSEIEAAYPLADGSHYQFEERRG